MDLVNASFLRKSVADPAPPRQSPMTPFIKLYDLFVFDLDGTLADTLDDIARSLNRALSGLGRPPLDLGTVKGYVGNGARVLVERALGEGSGKEAVDRAFGLFLEDYGVNCLVSTRLYPGVQDTLGSLARQGKRLAVLTNKPTSPAARILEGLGAGTLFASIIGGDRMPRKKPDPSGLLGIIESAGALPARTLLVGDTGIDTATARAAGARSAWVPYGFQASVPSDPPPDHVLGAFADLAPASASPWG